MAGYVMRQLTCPKAVTHPSTNWARCRATALIETNVLPLHQTATGVHKYRTEGCRNFKFGRNIFPCTGNCHIHYRAEMSTVKVTLNFCYFYLEHQAAAAVGSCWPRETPATLPSVRRRKALRRPREKRGAGHIMAAALL